MSVYHAIYGRRMAWSFKETEVSRSAIERMLDAAVWAPNHRMTEPWRFVVLEKDSPTRRKTSDLAYAAALERSDNTRRAAAAREKVLAPPYIIYAYATPGPDEKTTKENYAAVCCAVQNIALAGAAEGLAVTWDTGGVTRHAELKGLLGAEDDWELTAMLMIGFPPSIPLPAGLPCPSSCSGTPEPRAWTKCARSQSAGHNKASDNTATPGSYGVAGGSPGVTRPPASLDQLHSGFLEAFKARHNTQPLAEGVGVDLSRC